MHRGYRNKSDYKEGDIVYFAQIDDFIGAPSITLKKCIITKINNESNDFKCDAIYDCIAHVNLNSYKDLDISYGWLARSYDEAIKEIADHKMSNERKIRILFTQEKKY